MSETYSVTFFTERHPRCIETRHMSMITGRWLGPASSKSTIRGRFGQILSVVMIIAILNEFVHFIFGTLGCWPPVGVGIGALVPGASGRASSGTQQVPPPQSNVTYRAKRAPRWILFPLVSPCTHAIQSTKRVLNCDLQLVTARQARPCLNTNCTTWTKGTSRCPKPL